MGIQGLLKLMQPVTRKVNLSDFHGQAIGVDAMSWMHKGGFACAWELFMGIDTDKFIVYFLRQCAMLQYHDIKPIIVFDGARLPAKKSEEKDRKEAREAARKEAMELQQRKSAGEMIDERKLEQKCQMAIRITPQMINRLQSVLDQMEINYLVAPYEADAQLAYLCRIGRVHAVISEDGDLLAYGCPRTIFKMDRNSGAADFVELDKFTLGDRDDMSESEDEGLEEEREEQGSDFVKAAKAIKSAERTCQGPQKEKKTAKKDAEKRDALESTLHEPAEKDAEKDAAKAIKSAEKDAEKRDALESTIHDLASKNKDLFNVLHKFGWQKGAEGWQFAAWVQTTSLTKVVEELEVEKFKTTLQTWTLERFTFFCILLGCDYSKDFDTHIKGMGPKKALDQCSKYKDRREMIESMFVEKEWKDKFTCELETYIHRVDCTMAVFWHHNVFDNHRGEIVSISTAFNADRDLPGINLVEVCGKQHDRVTAVSVAKGQIDPNDLSEVVREPLTPAESRALEREMANKKADHRQAAMEEQLRQERQRAFEKSRQAAEAAAAKKLQEEAAIAANEEAAAAAAAELDVPEYPEDAAVPDLAERQPETDKGRNLLFSVSDLMAFQGAFDDKKERKGKENMSPSGDCSDAPSRLHDRSCDDTPPKEAPPAPVSNPFATKKRGHAALGTDAGAEPIKRTRQIDERTIGSLRNRDCPVSELGPIKAAPPRKPVVEVGVQNVLPRVRGGYAAKDCAENVAVKMGAPPLPKKNMTEAEKEQELLRKMEEEKNNKGSLRHYFNSSSGSKLKATTALNAEKHAKRVAAQALPEEKEYQEMYGATSNPLAMTRTSYRKNHLLGLKSGW